MEGDVNRQIRRLADMLPASQHTKFAFNCECGCGTVVTVTPSHFDAYGAWADGHQPGLPADPIRSGKPNAHSARP
jgi:hypothetical protein